MYFIFIRLAFMKRNGIQTWIEKDLPLKELKSCWAIKLLYLMILATYMLQNIDKLLTFLFLIKIRME